MDLQLETKRLILRPARSGDYQDLQEGLDNLNIAKNLSSLPNPYTLGMIKDYFGKNSKKWDEERIDDYLFVIELKSDKKVIGAMGIHNIDFDKGESETGSWINEKYWKNGYITEAKVAANDFAFKVLGLEKLISPVFEDNPASNATQKKMGYQYMGSKKDSCKCLATGIIHNQNIYELTRGRWADVRQGIIDRL